MSSAAVRKMAGKPTGTIKMSDLRGKSFSVSASRAYASSVNWVAPAGTTSIISLTARGGIGSESYERPRWYQIKLVQTYAFTGPGSIYTEVITSYEQVTNTTEYASLPASSYYYYFVGGETTDNDINHKNYRYVSTTYSKRVEYETTGGDYGGTTTAFGKGFTGTYGSTPVSSTYTNIPVVPGQSYYLSIPSGGNVSFTYEEAGVTMKIIAGNLTGTGTITIPANTGVSLVGIGAATATLNGVMRAWSLTRSIQTLSSGTAAQALSYVVPAGAVLSYHYAVPA